MRDRCFLPLCRTRISWSDSGLREWTMVVRDALNRGHFQVYDLVLREPLIALASAAKNVAYRNPAPQFFDFAIRRVSTSMAQLPFV